MTPEEAKENLNEYLNWRPENDSKMVHPNTIRESVEILLAECKALQSKLNDRLPNGGTVSHESKHSMMPTLKHDTE